MNDFSVRNGNITGVTKHCNFRSDFGDDRIPNLEWIRIQLLELIFGQQA
jgi:hypothetical protein